MPDESPPGAADDNVTQLRQPRPAYEVAYEELRDFIQKTTGERDSELTRLLDELRAVIDEMDSMLSLERMRGDSLFETGIALRDRAEMAERRLAGYVGGGEQMQDESRDEQTEGGTDTPDEQVTKETTTREDTTREETTTEQPAQKGEE
jgi:hypothetical protein